MIRTQITTDKFAITLSLVCVAHCFLVPSFFIMSAGFLSFSIDNELIHRSVVLLAVPISVCALSLGYKNHKMTSFLPAGVFGLLLLILAVVLGESGLGVLGEKALTLLGSILTVYAHYKNHQACRALDCSSCHEE